MVPRQLVDDRVLNRVQILKLVDENTVPAPAYSFADGVVPEQLSGFQHQGVEVDELALLEEFLIVGVEHPIVGAQFIAAKSVGGESSEKIAMPCRRNLEATEDGTLIVIVGDAEARLQSEVGAELAQQLSAESVNRSALYALGARSQLALESRSYLAGGLVGEGKHADAFGIEPALLDEESNPLDEAECLARPRTGENENGLRRSLDRLALGWGWDVRRSRREKLLSHDGSQCDLIDLAGSHKLSKIPAEARNSLIKSHC